MLLSLTIYSNLCQELGWLFSSQPSALTILIFCTQKVRESGQISRSQDDGGSVSAGDVRGEALHLLHCTSLTLRQSQSATKRGNYLLSSELTEILCQSTMYNVESIL